MASANDNAIIQGVAGFPTSLGFVGLAYAEENAGTVKMIPVDKAADGTCVAPEHRDGPGRQLPALSLAVHLPQPRPRGREPGHHRLRRLLPVG